MSKLEITLPDVLRAFVDEQVAAGRTLSASDFVRELVQDARHWQSRQLLEDALLDGVRSGPAVPITDGEWDAMRRKIRASTPAVTDAP